MYRPSLQFEHLTSNLYYKRLNSAITLYVWNCGLSHLKGERAQISSVSEQGDEEIKTVWQTGSNKSPKTVKLLSWA